MGSKIVSVFAFVVALGLLVFVVRSGAGEKLLSVAGDWPSLSFPRGATSTAKRGAPRRHPARQAPPPEQEREERPRINPRDIPAGFTEGDLSRYFGAVNLSVSRGRITLSARFKSEAKINITGWELKAKQGSLLVPQAVNVYDPSGLAPESDVFLVAGEIFKYFPGESAIGVNLRLNKCIGYLENTNDFSPSLPRSCPNPVNDFDMSRVTGACQDYIRSLRSCRLPVNNPERPDTDLVCIDYINRINLRGCYDRHRADPDFLDNEWWAWTRHSFLDPRHDTVLLLDREGKIVDIDEY